jgi:hypothetical protein
MGAFKTRSRKDISNHEIVTMAVYMLGGKSRAIDTEDVAVKANELAPGRYTWRKHTDQINIELIRTYLSDAKKARCGRYLIGTGNEGWMLTEAGLTFAKENLDRLVATDLTGERKTESEKRWLRRERVRLLGTSAFAKFRGGEENSITAEEASAFFRVDEYVAAGARQRKIARIVNTFRADLELGRAVIALAERATGK